MSKTWPKVFSIAVMLALVFAMLPAFTPPAQAISNTVVISQVYGAGGNTGAVLKNDFVELFNRGTSTISISGWSIQYASATGTGNFGSNPVAVLSGSIAPGQYYLVQLAGGTTGAVLPTPDATGTANLSGTTGKVILVNNSTGLACNGGSTPCSPAHLAQIVDLVGFGTANFYEGAVAPAPSATTSIQRAWNGCQDTDNNATDFTAGAPAPRNTASTFNVCSTIEDAPSVANTVPANDATEVSRNSNVTVNFSEPVNVTDPWFSLSCSTSGAHTAAVSGGPSSFTLDPSTDFAFGETCTLNIIATQVSDQDLIDPPDNMDADFSATFTIMADPCLLPYTSIPAIQGSGATVALPGPQITQGLVVGDYEGASPALRGFFIQDPIGDGDPATSDGIFVFEGSNLNTVSLGDVVRVTGNAGENQGQSQISVGSITQCGTGTVTPTDVSLPFPTADYPERYEGMLVRLPQTLYVTEHFQLGRFGQVVLSANARLQQPTNVVLPGAPALALQAANNLNRIILDDASQAQNPDPILFARGTGPLTASNTLRGGDTATGIVGVLNYTWAGNAASGNAYRVRPINALNGYINFEPTNPRPETVPDVGGTLKIVGMNQLNYFNTFDGLPDNVDNCTLGVGGAPTDCRGADTLAEFERQWPKTVAAILAMNPDVLGANEVENDGYGPDSSLQHLVDQLNAATAPGTYAFIDADAKTGQVNALGTDAIRVAMIYKPATVTPVGQTAVLNTVAFVNGGDSAPRSRPSLAQAFQQNSIGEVFIVDVNHLKSKGSACDAPDAVDGQGNCNIVRTNAANELANWLASDPTGTGDQDILLMGDYNSYAMEDPITTLKNAGYINMIETFLGPDAYSYVFDGQWGYLDHALASASIAAHITGVGDFHINADEPSVLDYNTDFKTANLQNILYAPDKFRVSDHDPVIVGLRLNDPPTVSAGGPYSVGEGSSVLVTATGTDPDNDPLSYAWDLDNNGTFETPGQSATFDAASLDGPSSYTINVQVTDAHGLVAAASTTVEVTNVAPTVGIPVVTPEPSTEGSLVTASAEFSDPGIWDTHTCTVDYGDGSGPQSGVVAAYQCSGPAHAYATYGLYTVTVTVTDKDGGVGANSALHTVIFNWAGFFSPVQNPPMVNGVKAGSSIPLKFSLGGFKGVDIFAPGYPISVQADCSTWAALDGGIPALNPGGSSLSYDPLTDQYNFVWKSDKSWAGTCRMVVVKLVDGTEHVALFSFK